jgi:rhodanese-related sulfurtransferase
MGCLCMKILVLSTAVLFSIASVSCAEKPAVAAPVKIEQAEKQLADGAQLLDVRTKEEWNEGHLKGATLVTVTEDGFLEKAKAALEPKKGVVVYCRSGKRSAMAAEQLRAAGFTVYDLDGGITAWQAAGKPVAK